MTPRDSLLGNADAAKETTTLPSVITVEELAELLRVNRDTVYKAVSQGKVPGARRIGRTIRISRNAVLDWLNGKDHAPHSSRRSR